MLFKETFEGTGYVETWSSGETVGASSTLDEDASSSDAGSPSGWGDQCLKVQVVSPDTSARVLEDLGASGYAKVYMGYEFVVTAEALADEENFSMLYVTNAGATNLLWTSLLHQLAGGAKALLDVIYHDAVGEVFVTAPVNLNERYRVEVYWNSTDNEWARRVNRVQTDSGSLTSTATGWNARFLNAGVDGNANAQGSTFYLDNIWVSETDWPFRFTEQELILRRKHSPLIGR